MKYECDLIRDIMPLCADDLATEASRRALEAHLSECEACAKEWENMSGTIKPYPAEPELLNETKTYTNTVKRIRHHRRHIVILAFLLGACIAFGGSFYRRAKQTGLCLKPEAAAVAGAELAMDMTDVRVLGEYRYPDNIYEVFLTGQHPAWDPETHQFTSERKETFCQLTVMRNRHSYGLWHYAGSGQWQVLEGDEGIVFMNLTQSALPAESDAPRITMNACYVRDPQVKSIELSAYGKTEKQQIGEEAFCIFSYPDAPLSEYYSFSGQAYGADGKVLYELSLDDYEYVWKPNF